MKKWTPPQDVYSHASTHLPHDMIFPVAPPPQIGKVLTAWSTFEKSKHSLSSQINGPIATAVGAVTAIGLFLICYANFPDSDEFGSFAIISIIMGAVAGCAGYFIKPKFIVTFVGDQGAVRYVFQSLGTPSKKEGVLFKDVTDLRTEEAQQHFKGDYAGTLYKYVYRTPRGEPVMTMSGAYSGESGDQPPEHPYHFALAAEHIYSQVCLRRLSKEFEQTGRVQFRVGNNKLVNVGRGFLEFDFNGNRAVVKRNQIQRLRVRSGFFEIRSTSAGGFFSNEGKFTFQYGKMSNAEAFLQTLKRLVGVGVEGID